MTARSRDRAPSTVWILRKDMKQYVVTGPDDTIVLCSENSDGLITTIVIDRSTARLFAKRINQCLDATRKR